MKLILLSFLFLAGCACQDLEHSVPIDMARAVNDLNYSPEMNAAIAAARRP